MKSLLSIFLFTGLSILQAHAMTAQEVVKAIQANVTCEWSNDTVDTFKAGDPNTTVTGIVTTFTPSYEVLKKAVDAGCNMIITHEPTYYSGNDDYAALDDDKVLQDKLKYIAQNGLVIWRFHDHLHRTNPDGIYEGMIDRLGWRDFLVEGKSDVFKIPQTTLLNFANILKQKFAVDTIRVIGDPKLETTKAGLSAGSGSSINQMKMLGSNEIDILVIGETREWETVEYARDAMAQGKNKALVILGHCISEEAGMKYCATWLEGFIKDIPITFIPAENPFWTP
jgi:putative NIF3 family GTP cyclohydrolase 1 type 2